MMNINCVIVLTIWWLHSFTELLVSIQRFVIVYFLVSYIGFDLQFDENLTWAATLTNPWRDWATVCRYVSYSGFCSVSILHCVMIFSFAWRAIIFLLMFMFTMITNYILIQFILCVSLMDLHTYCYKCLYLCRSRRRWD